MKNKKEVVIVVALAVVITAAILFLVGPSLSQVLKDISAAL